MKVGVINTTVDGIDIGFVNLWSEPVGEPQLSLVGSCQNGENVLVVSEHNDYVMVEKAGAIGWCNKAFVKYVD